MALEEAGQGSFGDGQDHEDLGIGAALFAEREDLLFQVGRSFARLLVRPGGKIRQACGEVGGLGAREPLADGFLGDTEGRGGGAERPVARQVELNQFSSHERGEFGISVHVVRAG